MENISLVNQAYIIACVTAFSFTIAYFIGIYHMRKVKSSIKRLNKLIYGPSEIKFRKVHPDAQIPQKFHSADDYGNLGADLEAVEVEMVKKNGLRYLVYNTGLAFEAPYPLGLLAIPRSSLSKTSLMLSNSIGVIDRNYRGEVLVVFKVEESFTDDQVTQAMYEEGDRVIQMVATIIPNVQYKEYRELSDSARGSNGFGSTGRN